VHSVMGMQKLCKTPVREVCHNRKTPKIENSPCKHFPFNNHKSIPLIASREDTKTQGEARGEGDTY
jgi:hypothetical protein